MPDMRFSDAMCGNRTFHASHRIRVDKVYFVFRDKTFNRPAPLMQIPK
jgi:hypothetical protein